MSIYDKPYMFNIVMNSQQASAFSSANTNDKTYLFNWTNIPQRRYKITMYWAGKNNADFVSDDSPQVFITFGDVPCTYLEGAIDGSFVSYYAGTFRPDTHAADQVSFVADGMNHNSELYLNSVPTYNQIRIQVFRSDFITPFTTLAGSNLADYVCVLQFKEIK